jgi:protein-arginine kinase activator protein McsA
MSKHIGRKERWVNGGNCHTTFNGYIQRNYRGWWNGYAVYQKRMKKNSTLVKQYDMVGEFKRPEQAKMVVEDRLKLLRATIKPTMILF